MNTYFSNEDTEENISANKYNLRCLKILLITIIIILILNELKIFIIANYIMRPTIFSCIIIVLIPLILEKKYGHSSTWFKYLLIICFITAFAIFNIGLTFHALITWGIPFLMIAQYNNKKLSRFVLIYTMICVTLSVFLGYSFGVCDLNYITETTESFTKLDPNINLKYKGFSKHAITKLLLFFTLPRLMIIFVYSRISEEISSNIRAISYNREQANANNTKLLTEILSIAEQVQVNMNTGTAYIDELANSSNEALEIYKEIANSNVRNTNRVKTQTELSNNITNLINDVVTATNDAINSSNLSKNELLQSKDTLIKLKNNSEDIKEFNDKVLFAIQEFVNKANNVKNITAAINDLSEETNLLSLNASIESARAGEAGKGFAVVANSIRNLADETTNLTSIIDTIVKELEINAQSAQLAVSAIVDFINDENSTITETMDNFKTMESIIHNVDINMNNILDKTNEVVDYNKIILEHANDLFDSTQEVTSYTKKALQLNEENNTKTQDTKKIMNNLLEVINEMTTNSIA